MRGWHSQQLQLVLPPDESVLLVDQREPLLDQHLLLQPVGTCTRPGQSPGLPLTPVGLGKGPAPLWHPRSQSSVPPASCFPALGLNIPSCKWER